MKKYYLYLFLLFILTACSKMDDYKKFQQGGEISYPGIMDSVKVFAGKNRVKVTGLFTSDPKITHYRLFWNNHQDSLEVPVIRKGYVDTAVTYVPNLKEGAISIEIRTYDAKNNVSIPLFALGNAYGAQYEDGVGNRSAASTAVTSEGLKIDWAQAPPNSIFSTVRYMVTNGEGKSVIVNNGDEQTMLPGYAYGTKITVVSAYLPEPGAIDTFHAARADTLIKENALSSWYTSSGTRINYTGPKAGNVIAGSSALSGDKKAVELNATQVEIDYANLAANGWKYILTYDGSKLTVAVNATMLSGIKPGSFKVVTASYDKISGTLHLITGYTNTAGDDREVNETLTLL
ncbi:DUF4998 domain-containing protein [Chitinophaga arvensicola]|uniref:DUF5017 domain-containing protein n=1 Tax=Chitinophaga arvensicola TaxID=29529 RepID=A0A1I0RSP7_9BACT|nr:DUF4998 domain-containing protein [Chitinophaga arvensicola]SEW44386.1 protein of unknown function [Chitinophaga arvensicola]